MLTVFIVWLQDAALDAVAVYTIEATDWMNAIQTAQEIADLGGVAYEWIEMPEPATETEAKAHRADREHDLATYSGPPF